MTSWAAANAPKLSNNEDGDDQNHRQRGGGNKLSSARHGVSSSSSLHIDENTSSRRRSTETVEAALSRLSKAYMTGMECIGALQQMNRMLEKQKQQTQQPSDPRTDWNQDSSQSHVPPQPPPSLPLSLSVMEEVANAGRTTFETAILWDPLVVSHLPTLDDERLKQRTNSQPASTGSATKHHHDHHHHQNYGRRPETPTIITSVAHKSTIKELAYLALVNYSDLLLMCRRGGDDHDDRKKKNNNGDDENDTTTRTNAPTNLLLDRGIIPKIPILQEHHKSCWKDESEEETLRFAVTALCDASNLDGSDPVLWLKLACASRQLENVLLLGPGGGLLSSTTTRITTTLGRLRHRRLQRYALEQGSLALPPHMPPNRAVQRALQEFLGEPEIDEYVSHPENDNLSKEEGDSIRLVFDLPRYSWSVLGRLLLRVCREGTNFHQGHKHPPLPSSTPSGSIRSSRGTTRLFGFPMIEISLSPMLVLPVRVLGRVCLYLDSGTIRRFEATCRALSVSIMSARAVMEDEKHREMEKAPELRHLLPGRRNSSASSTNRTMKGTEDDNDDVGGGILTKEGEDDGQTIGLPTKKSHNSSQQGLAKDKGQPTAIVSREHSRSSQRLRTQQITSGKKMERFAKRQSFEYCFLAATLGCSIEEHKAALEDTKTEESILRLLSQNDSSSSDINARVIQHQALQLMSGRKRESQASISDSSLSSFVERYSGQNSGPMDLVSKYLVHVAMHVEDVFASDPSGTVALTSCILSCFEALLKRTGYQEHLVPVFFKGHSYAGGDISKSLEGFALDILHGELILKQCDRSSPIHTAFDSAANMIGMMVPQLHQAYTELEEVFRQERIEEDKHRHFARLKIRCNWLLAGFYMWRSGIAPTTWEAQAAEDEGTAFIEESLISFDSPFLRIQALPTPQLVSPARTESYWRELSPASLRKYRDEIQASTVVSVVREKFQDLIATINSRNHERLAAVPLTEVDSRALAEIGDILFQRYKPGGTEQESKHGELIEDFLSVHGNTLAASEEDRKKLSTSIKVEEFVPLEVVDDLSPEKMTNPSILTMLTLCMMVEVSNRDRVQQLLVCLVLETRKVHLDLLGRIASSRGQVGEADDGFSDSDDDSSSGNSSTTSSPSNKNIDERRALQCGHLMAYLIQRIEQCLSKASNEMLYAFAISDDCSVMLETALGMSSEWFQSTSQNLMQEDNADLFIFQSVGALVGRLSDCLSTATSQQYSLEAQYVARLSRTMITHQHIFSGLVANHGDRSSRVTKQRCCMQRAEYIGAVASEIGIVLSRYLCAVDNLLILSSPILMGKEACATGAIPRMSNAEMNHLIDSTHWLSRFSSQSLTENQGSEIPTCTSFDRPLVKTLRVPIAAMVIGLCGSSARSRDVCSSREANDGPLHLSEFYDTDDSANEGLSDGVETTMENRKMTELLRVACHVVQCVNLALDKIDDKGALSLVSAYRCTGLGPVLPLVASRVLNFFADTLLSSISGDDKNPPDLWAPQYPMTTRTIGEILDACLHKVYRWMYGFVLVGEKSIAYTVGKDLASSTAPIVDLAVTDCKLESLSSAACLYRCIVRTYGSGRRSPPKKALEMVSAALPAVEETEKRSKIRNFVFGTAKSYPSMEQVQQIVSHSSGWDSLVSSISEQLTSNDDYGHAIPKSSDDAEVATRIRRGILSQLADGAVAMNSNDNSKGKSDQGQDDDRVVSIKHEDEVGKKFDAILDAICLSDARNSHSWLKAARCLNTKAELIADRLGINEGFTRIGNFSVPLPRHRTVRGIQLQALLKQQEDADSSIHENWIFYLGSDLSAYVKFSWASHDSLLGCHQRVGEDCRKKMMLDREDNKKRTQYQIWLSLDALHAQGEYLAWQEAWGGMFVAALREISLRFMVVALYLLMNKEDQTADDRVLISEIRESVGVIFYSDLMGSQSYGYPMHSMGVKRKRDLATTAKVCFEGAVACVNEPETPDDGSDGVPSTWDLIFMIGKCEEKIAGSYSLEMFPTQPEGVRLYEKHTTAALNSYSAALAQVKKIEEDGGTIVDQSGGSSHGRTEIEYRILALRLKCLIASAVRDEREFDQAEEESLRLSGCHWFREPEDLNAWKQQGVRDRVWSVLADIVAGLAQCRIEHPFFHRSVYRHAQALMWAPVLWDPTSAEGSHGSAAPTSNSCLIAGLTTSAPACQSAENVICGLFDKKRPQLCAVWVTSTNSSSPFETLNSSSRKYDSLRGKYIAAYIECLRLSNRRAKIETFLKLLSTTPRDVASYFQASGRANACPPPKSHMNEPLLILSNSLSEKSLTTSIKRKTNSAFASSLLHDMLQRQSKKAPVDEKKQAETDLKFAFATYLRLNCSKQDLDSIKAWSYHKFPIREVEALCHAYLALRDEAVKDTESPDRQVDMGDWTGGGRKAALFQRVLAKCVDLYPNLTPNFFSKKASATSKLKKDSIEGDANEPNPGNRGSKRKEVPASTTQGTETSTGSDDMVTVSYEVVVPAGLAPGQSFLTTINVGGTKKQFRLTVPETNPSTLRFRTQVPRSSMPEVPAQKKART